MNTMPGSPAVATPSPLVVRTPPSTRLRVGPMLVRLERDLQILHLAVVHGQADAQIVQHIPARVGHIHSERDDRHCRVGFGAVHGSVTAGPIGIDVMPVDAVELTAPLSIWLNTIESELALPLTLLKLSKTTLTCPGATVRSVEPWLTTNCGWVANSLALLLSAMIGGVKEFPPSELATMKILFALKVFGAGLGVFSLVAQAT